LTLAKNYLPLILIQRSLHNASLFSVNACLSPSSQYQGQAKYQISSFCPLQGGIILSPQSSASKEEAIRPDYEGWPSRVIGCIIIVAGIFISKLALDAISVSFVSGIIVSLIGALLIVGGIAVVIHVFPVDVSNVLIQGVTCTYEAT
jgi:hypothetical protein